METIAKERKMQYKYKRMIYTKVKRILKKGRKIMTRFKNVLIIVIISMLVIMMVTVVNATDDDTYTNIIDEGTSNNNTNNTTLNNTNTNNTVKNNTTNNNTTNKTNNGITNANTLPKAGTTQNISAIVIAIIFGISAVYAYKKIKDYNIK